MHTNWSINFIPLDDMSMLNYDLLGKNKPTDVISLPNSFSEEEMMWDGEDGFVNSMNSHSPMLSKPALSPYGHQQYLDNMTHQDQGSSEERETRDRGDCELPGSGVVTDSFYLQDYLGEIYVCPEYVHQVMQEDKDSYYDSSTISPEENMDRKKQPFPPLPSFPQSDTTASDTSNSTALLSPSKAYHRQPEARGVNVWMLRSQTLEERIKYLLIHSTLHLCGYDHELRNEYKQMVLKEEEIVLTLKNMNVL